MYQFCDPFDTATTMVGLYETTAGSPNFSSSWRRFIPPTGLPGQGVKFTVNQWGRKNLLTNALTLTGNIGILMSQLNVPFNFHLVGFLDTATEQVRLSLSNAGHLQFVRGTTTIVQTNPGVIQPNIYYGIGFLITFHASAGVLKLWLNQAAGATPLISLTGQVTIQTGHNWCNQVSIGTFTALGGSDFMLVDDFYVFDDTGTTQNAYAGDLQLISKVPIGAGDLTQWTPNGAAANWQCVDSIPPNDAIFTSSATPGQEDSYLMPSAGLVTAPAFVTQRQRWWRDDAGPHSMKSLMRRSGANVYGPAVTLGNAPLYVDTCFPLDQLGAPWTAANADAAQGGKNLVS